VSVRSGSTDVAQDALRAATAAYRAGATIDMSAIAQQLGVGRATLYRHVGSRDQLLARVLEDATVRTFRRSRVRSGPGSVDAVVARIEQFMVDVLDSAALRVLIEREPVVFMRLVLGPGSVEDVSSALVQELLEQELGADLLVEPAVLARAIVRVCDSLMYAHLLNNTPPALDSALEVVSMLLTAAHSSSRGRVGPMARSSALQPS
jgi:AcrR family transcriptional regulator